MLAIHKIESEIVESIGKYLRDVANLEASAICEVQESIKRTFETRDKTKIIEEISKYPGCNGYVEQISLMNFQKLLYEPSETINFDKLIPVVKSYVEEKDSIIFIDKKINYENIKQICRAVIKENNQIYSVEISPLPFVVTSDFEEIGMISAQISETKKQLQLIKQYEDKQGEQRIIFFGEHDDLQMRKKERRFVVPFYFYRFRQKDREYIVLSQEEIEIGDYTLKGMKVTMADDTKVGESLKISTNMSVIFVLKIEPLHTKATEEECWEYTKGKTYEDWAYRIRGNYTHPVEFEKLLFAFLFSGKFQDFPLSIAWVAPPGTGKTRFIEAMQSQIQEDQPVFSGSQSTGLGLVPSYGGATYQEGHILSCRRIAFVDEFTVALFRHRGSTDAQDITAKMTEILEHKTRIAICGKGKLKTKPRARVFFAMNPQPLADLMEMSKHFNRAFMSRILWYVQTPQHIEYIDNKKDLFAGDNLIYPQHDEKFIAILDYLQSFCLIKGKEISKKIVEIIKTNQQYVPSELIDTFYKPRAIHHVGCLLDGIAKINSLLENRGKFEITEKDMQETDELFSMIVQSWNPQDLSRMPMTIKRYYLKDKDRRIFEWICQAINPTRIQIADAFGITEMGMQYHLDTLMENKLIVQIKEEDGSHFFPYWHLKARQVTASREVYEEAMEERKMEEI